MPERAFALKESVSDFSGGSVALRDGETVDLKRRLANGDGQIKTDDPELQRALESLDVFKEVPVGRTSAKSSTSKEG